MKHYFLEVIGIFSKSIYLFCREQKIVFPLEVTTYFSDKALPFYAKGAKSDMRVVGEIVKKGANFYLKIHGKLFDLEDGLFLCIKRNYRIEIGADLLFNLGYNITEDIIRDALVNDY